MTPHNEANIEDIANVVLMPGDPLRAEYIAKTYLNDYKIVNSIRNNYAFTGYYKGHKITVMSSGMGIPSIGIYSYELYNFYNVDLIIRIGSSGAYSDDLSLYDIVLVKEAFSESTYAISAGYKDTNIVEASKDINEEILKTANTLNKKVRLSRIHSADAFYSKNFNYLDALNNYGVECVEMESFGLFTNAIMANKKAACLLTISDTFGRCEKISAIERQTSFNDMIVLALEAAIKYAK